MADSKVTTTPAQVAAPQPTPTPTPTPTPSVSLSEFNKLKAGLEQLTSIRNAELNAKKGEVVTQLMGQVNPQFSALAYQQLSAAADPQAKFEELSKIANFKKPGVAVSSIVNNQLQPQNVTPAAEPADIPILDDELLATDIPEPTDREARLRQIWKDMDENQRIGFRALARNLRSTPRGFRQFAPTFSADGNSITFQGKTYSVPKK